MILAQRDLSCLNSGCQGHLCCRSAPLQPPHTLIAMFTSDQGSPRSFSSIGYACLRPCRRAHTRRRVTALPFSRCFRRLRTWPHSPKRSGAKWVVLGLTRMDGALSCLWELYLVAYWRRWHYSNFYIFSDHYYMFWVWLEWMVPWAVCGSCIWWHIGDNDIIPIFIFFPITITWLLYKYVQL
jgi:hypothetical protein